MHTANETRSESSTVHFVAATLFLVIFGSGYAISTHVEGASDQATLAIPVVPAGEQAQTYFPAQYVNQGKEVEEHIQAF